MTDYTLTVSKSNSTLRLNGHLPGTWQNGDRLKFINNTTSDVEYKIVASQDSSNSQDRVITDPPNLTVPATETETETG